VVNYLDLLRLAAPEIIVVITAVVVLAVDLSALRNLEPRLRFGIGAIIAAAGCAAAIAWMLVLPQQGNFGQMLVADPVTQIVSVGILALAIFTVALCSGADFTSHAGEYYALLLLAAAGMLFLASSEDVLMIFLSLELTSLTLYVLTAFNKRSARSAEAALKYFLFGGTAAAFTLFGLSWLYGITGSTNLGEAAEAIKAAHLLPGSPVLPRTSLDPLLAGALVMTVAGFGFKVAAAPFHLWAPDAYEGAPLPSAAFIASASKVAGFFIFAKVMRIGFAGVGGCAAWGQFASGWKPLLAVLAIVSMILGNLAALAQRSVRRLLAYSAIAHAGYMLLGIIGHQKQSLAALLYYALTYGLTTIGAFGVVSMVQAETGGDRLEDFAGLSRRAPVLAWSMMVFMLSLAGIPPLAGFLGKFYLFTSVLGSGGQDLGLLWLVLLAVAMSVVSLYYYLLVLKQVFVRPASEPAGFKAAPLVARVVVAALALAVLALGCAPNLLLQPLTEAVTRTSF
jgi:NADH-quinone oxidoreductase subunit N